MTRVVITRPAGDSTAWVNALEAAGHHALALPLIDLAPTPHTEPVLKAWAQWSDWQAIMFVSAQAVRYFFECQPAVRAWKNGPRCWATGPGTHKALLQAGVPDECIDSPAADAVQFDSEALWQRVTRHVQSDKPVLIVRGLDVESESGLQRDTALGTGRDWLAQQLHAAGAKVQFVVAYERRPPVWTEAQKHLASQAAADGSVWCFSSSQAIGHLAKLLPLQSWHHARCIATHDRIAKAAQALGFAEVYTERPGLGDVLRSLESLA